MKTLLVHAPTTPLFGLPLLFILALLGFPQGAFGASVSDEGIPITTTSLQEPPATTLPAYKTEFTPSRDVFGDFVVGPAKTELLLKPGESKTTEILVTNRMGVERTFSLDVEDVTGTESGDSSVVLLGDERGPYTLKDYLQFPSETVTLDHAERARIPVTVSIPENAEPGGRYGSVIIQTVTDDVSTEEGVNTVSRSAIVSRIATLFFVTVEGETEVGGMLEKFTTIPEKSWFQNGPIQFGIYFRNTGNVHLNPYGHLRITNMFNEEVGYVELDPWFALPQSRRFREVTWERNYLFGKYTAELEISPGFGDEIETAAYTFWVIPYSLIFGIFVGVFILIFIIRLFFRTFEFKRRSS